MECAYTFAWGSNVPHERRAAALMTIIRSRPISAMEDAIYLTGQKAAMFKLPPFRFVQYLNHHGVSIARMGYVDEMRRIRDRFSR
jgi:hypothetical protein